MQMKTHLTVFTGALWDHTVSIWLPGSVGAAGGPTTALHCSILVGAVSGLIALATQSKFQCLVDTKQPISLYAAQAHLHRSHLWRVQTVSLCQQLISWDVDEQFVWANSVIQQDPPDEICGIWPCLQGPAGRRRVSSAVCVSAVAF